VRSLVFVGQDAYYVYHAYPREKGTGYIYPELRYTFGQIAIFLWSAFGVFTALLTARSHKCASRSILAFALGFVLLVVGFVAGMAMMDFGL